ncbi:MAG: glycoside hydrolase superfamily [Linnemannia gamsii]|nr:MAG: glycoside hydrolase superfamily [Linnemannia gamsii]
MIHAFYSLSAAVALVSNVFLLSLLVSPDPLRPPVAQAALWPKPAYACHGHRTVQVSNEFRFDLPQDSHPRLVEGAARFRNRIFNSDFVSPVPMSAEDAEMEDRSHIGEGGALKLRSLVVDVEDRMGSIALGLGIDESYRLSIAYDEAPNSDFELNAEVCKQIAKEPFGAGFKGILKAKTIYGALHGLETFTQLVTNSAHDTASSGTKEIAQTPLLIHDRPLFPHRGVLLDTSRNFLSMVSLYRTIDAMAMNKFNVFHWHIVDSPSFPIAQLAAKGAFSEKMVYTKKDISEFVDYAMDRGVRVIPEIDMPGHAWSWSKAFPEITTCLDGFPSYSRFSAEPPSGQLNPVHPKTFQVIQGVYDQVLPLFKDKFVHGGADEVNFNCWNATKSVVDLMESKNIPRSKEGFDKVLDGFTERQHEMLRHAKKRPIVWEEPLLAHDLTTIKENKDTVIQVWTSAENIKKTVRQGYDVITGSADYWYMDCGFGDWLGNWTMGKSWCAYSDWQKAYSFNPLLGLNSKESKKVLGGEALLWGEQVDNTNLDSKLWPRASAVAEVLWSGNSDDSSSKLWDGRKQTKNTLRHIEALDRINEHRFRMEAEKILAEPLQPLWCVKNPGHCNWPILDTKPEDMDN